MEEDENLNNASLEEGLPRNVKERLRYIHAAAEENVAHTELTVNRIYKMKDQMGVQYEIDILDNTMKEHANDFVTANKGVLENKAASSRLRERIRDSKKERFKLEYQILGVKYDINEYKTVKLCLEKYVEQYSVFEEFLKRVSETSPEFNSVGDVMNRYEALEATRKDIARMLEREFEETNILRRQMLNVMEEKANALKALGNKLIMLQVARKEAKERRMYWETKLEKLKNHIGGRQEEAVTLRGACGDLYRKLCEARGLRPTIADDNMGLQLTFIQKSIAYQKDVYAVAMAVRQQMQAGVYKRSAFIRSSIRPGEGL